MNKGEKMVQRPRGRDRGRKRQRQKEAIVVTHAFHPCARFNPTIAGSSPVDATQLRRFAHGATPWLALPTLTGKESIVLDLAPVA